jgi:hypothetical protein
MIGKRQRLRVLHAADPAKFTRADLEHAARAKCVGITRARFSSSRSDAAGQPKNNKLYTAHQAPRTARAVHLQLEAPDNIGRDING